MKDVGQLISILNLISLLQGPLQPSGSECGYYVMRAMHDIINTSYDATTLPEVYIYQFVYYRSIIMFF